MINKKLTCSLLSSLILAGSSLMAEDTSTTTVTSEPIEVNETTTIEPVTAMEVFKMMGYAMSKRVGLDQLNFTESNLDLYKTTVASAIAGDSPSPEVMDQFQSMQETIEGRVKAGEAGEEVAEADNAVVQALAFMMTQMSQVTQFAENEEEEKSFLAGIDWALDQPEPEEGMQEKFQQIGPFLQQRIEQKAAAAKQEAVSFLSDLEAKEGIVKDENGLLYEILEEGEGEAPTMEDTVVVHYHGTLPDGTVFDSSVERGEPTEFPMSGVIPGFSGGLAKIKEGGKVKIYIPSELGYGENPPPGSPIPAGGVIIFDCELVTVKKATPAAVE